MSAAVVLSFRGCPIIRERLSLAPRLVGPLGLLALAAWVFSGARQQPGPEEFSSAWVVKAQPPPKEQASAWPQPSPSVPIPEPLHSKQMAEPSQSETITIMCGRLLWRKKNFLDWCSARSGADMCAAFDAAHTPQARMGVRGSGPSQAHALEAPVAKLVVPIPSP